MSAPALEKQIDGIAIDFARIPRHVAVIMDGNGRWAKSRGLPRILGHQAGVKTVRTVCETARELGVGVLTLYAFSVENWKRPEEETSALMGLLNEYLRRELLTMMKNEIRLGVIGDLAGLPDDVQKQLNSVIAETAGNGKMLLNLALNYGGRAEIVQAVQRIAREVKAGRLDPERVDEETINRSLYTAGQPDPDLLIRTSGEMRVSNFLLWQISYAEIYITQKLWPDFARADFLAAVAEYQKRDRRFGASA